MLHINFTVPIHNLYRHGNNITNNLEFQNTWLLVIAYISDKFFVKLFRKSPEVA